MKIVKMIQSKHVPDRWYAELSDGGRLEVNLSMIAQYSLYTGRELTDEETENLRGDAEKTSLKARALLLLGARSMSARELADKLRRKGADEAAVSETVAWLEKMGYINDSEYAKMIVRHYSARGYGARRIREELYRRGIERELGSEAMLFMPEPDDAIDGLIAKKMRGKNPDEKELKKTADMLMRRGYSWDEVKSALRRYKTEAEEE